jgi:hypothetical protein
MSEAPGRPKQANAPSGGQRRTRSAERGGNDMSEAPGRPKQANAPSGGSDGHAVPSVGAIT